MEGFPLCAEETSGKLSLVPMVGHTVTAFAVAPTIGGAGTGTGIVAG